MRLSRFVGTGILVALALAWTDAGEVGSAMQAAPAPQSATASPGAPGSRVEEAYRLNNLGVAQLEQYDYDAASATLAKALDLAPTLQLARINLAIALLHAGKLAEAQKAAEQARDADPAAPQPYYVIGLAARAENRADVAAPALEQVLKIDPGDIGARVNLGQVYLQQQRYEDAAALFRAASEAEPYNATAAYNLGVAYMRGGQAEEAERAMARFQALRASGYATTFSNNYLERGRYAEAVTATGAEADLVDRATPAVAFVPEEVAAPPANTGTAGAGHGAVTLADVDRDGDLDLVAAGPQGTVLYVNDGTRLQRAARQPPWPSGTSNAVVVADVDNDLLPDIAVASETGVALLRQETGGTFKDISAPSGIVGAAASRTLAFVDLDHDGDVDLVVSGGPASQAATAGSVRLYRNNGNSTFTDATAAAGLEARAHDVAIVPSDVDNLRDVDLLFVPSDAAPRLMRNLRDGRFGASADNGALATIGGATAVAAGDVNKDGFTDFVIASPAGAGIVLGSKGRTFVAGPALPGAASAAALLTFDYDNDGLLDLLAALPDGLRAWRNEGKDWVDVTDRAIPAEWRPGARSDPFQAAAAGDLDGDGDTDLVVRTQSGRVLAARNRGGDKLASLSVRLTGRVSNRSAVGASVEMRAGSLWQKLEVTSTSPPIAATGLVFGLGRRTQADVVRVLWPSGVLQAEPVAAPTGRTATLDLTELDRKPSSCPFLYTWNGTRFEFLTDFMGGGEMGYLHAPGVRSVPDPDEYVRIPGDRLVPRDGRLDLRVTNELEETTFIDRLRLLAVTHPHDVAIFPAEGLKSPPYEPFGVYVAPALRAPARAVDDTGADMRERLARVDRRYVDGFGLEAIRGYARPHTLTLDLGEAGDAGARDAAEAGHTLLVLTGWTDYAFSSDNLAAHQAGLTLAPPSLQVKDERGQWRTVIEEIGIPVGRPQAVVVDLTGKFLSASREVRIATTMRIYWDQAMADTSGRARFVALREPAEGGEAHADLAWDPASAGLVAVTRLEPTVADLRWRGFSAETSIDGRGPLSYDYDRVTSTSPWKLMPGRYTREGDVRELLTGIDDMFVVSRPGDEIALSFDATALPALGSGFTRTYLLFSHGYSKEMDLSSASPDQVAPLPFGAMSSYPYRWPEHYPDTPAHREYVERYNTRVVGRIVPLLDTFAAASKEAGKEGVDDGAPERTGGGPR